LDEHRSGRDASKEDFLAAAQISPRAPANRWRGSFAGVAALPGMLNTCAPNVSVVNIDNGFGAECIASLINHV
jgi:hypothetical protein